MMARYARPSLMGCLECGTCCHSDLVTYVRVLGDDHARLGDDAERLSHFVGNRCFMRMEDGHCAALVVEQGKFVCSVYAQRPEVCRALAEGSDACAAEIALKGTRPQQTLSILKARGTSPHKWGDSAQNPRESGRLRLT